MLPAVHRMRHRGDFTVTVRKGRRCGNRLLVAHAYRVNPRLVGAAPQVGFIVSRGVGGAVVRTAVKRRLRAQTAHLLAELPEGTLWVVRAQPASATASSRELSQALSTLIARLNRGGLV